MLSLSKQEGRTGGPAARSSCFDKLSMRNKGHFRSSLSKDGVGTAAQAPSFVKLRMTP
jgi:hypothetical protein